MRRVLCDTPPEELSDHEDFAALSPESPPISEPSHTKIPALTAAEYFAASPLRKRSSLSEQVKEEPE